MPERVADLQAEHLAERQRDDQACDDADQRKQVVFASGGAGHAFEELPAVENADPVQEHDQPGEADRADDLRFRRERPDGEPDEENRAHAQRKPADVDLPDEIAEADGEKGRQDRLCADDLTCRVEHGAASAGFSAIVRRSSHIAAGRLELADDTRAIRFRRRRLRLVGGNRGPWPST